MENNSTETKVNPTLGERMKIFMQYLGHPFIDNSRQANDQLPIVLYVGHEGSYNAGLRQKKEGPYADFRITNFTLLLKPLGRISEQDKEAVLLIEWQPFPESKFGEHIEWGQTWNECWAKSNAGGTHLGVHSFQYLQEKGYALPYKQWSVEQLVEFGIYKLIEA